MPQPVKAQQGCKCHLLLSFSSLRHQISCLPVILAWSFLLAKTRTDNPSSYFSCIRSSNSALASSILSQSYRSATNTIAVDQTQQCLSRFLYLTDPPMSQTIRVISLCLTSSTLKPIIGTELTTCPSFIWYMIVVFPVLSRPKMTVLPLNSVKQRTTLVQSDPILQLFCWFGLNGWVLKCIYIPSQKTYSFRAILVKELQSS